MVVEAKDLVEQIHAAPMRFALAVTGGGAGAIAALLGVPGASRTVIEALVPYHEQALIDFLGCRPTQFCDAETARTLARRARERGCWLAADPGVAGLGCTASLISDRPKRGEHRVHVALETASIRLRASLTLRKGARDRPAEEEVVEALILNLMAEAAGVDGRVPIALLPDEAIERQQETAPDPLRALLKENGPAITVFPDGQICPALPPAALLPGAFNPPHQGHWTLAATVSRRTGLAVGFELSAANVDKPPLSIEEVRRRMQAFAWRAPLWITRAPTFVEKSRLFPGTLFVVGADTAERIVQPRYYGDSAERMHEALAEIRRNGCAFLVGGRADELGAFRCLERVQVHEEFQTLFSEIPAEEFRYDVSSTQIRARGEMA